MTQGLLDAIRRWRRLAAAEAEAPPPPLPETKGDEADRVTDAYVRPGFVTLICADGRRVTLPRGPAGGGR